MRCCFADALKLMSDVDEPAAVILAPAIVSLFGGFACAIAAGTYQTVPSRLHVRRYSFALENRPIVDPFLRDG